MCATRSKTEFVFSKLKQFLFYVTSCVNNVIYQKRDWPRNTKATASLSSTSTSMRIHFLYENLFSPTLKHIDTVSNAHFFNLPNQHVSYTTILQSVCKIIQLGSIRIGFKSIVTSYRKRWSNRKWLNHEMEVSNSVCR